MTLYGVYRGDEFVDVGTPEELAERHNVGIETVYYWKSPHNHHLAERPKQNGEPRGQLVAVKLPKDDSYDLEEWNR